MKIISLNTWAGVVLDPLLTFFKKYQDVDVFCLQEIYHNAIDKDEPHPTLDMKLDLYERISKQLQDKHVGYFRAAHKDYYGQAIFVKKELEVTDEGDVVIFSNPNPEGRGRHNRNLQYIRLMHKNKKITIANVHGLWNGQGKTDTEERLAQSKEIRNFIDKNINNLIVVGDFNLNPDTQSIAIIEGGLQNLIKDHGITSTRTELYEKEGKFADYAFVSKDIIVNDFKVLPDVASDHAALYLEI